MPSQIIPVRSGLKHRPKVEHRATVRFPKDEEIWCKPKSTSGRTKQIPAWSGRVRDISTTGIGLTMSRWFEPGTALIVRLRPRILRHLLVHVIHAAPDADGHWIIGCMFDRPLSSEQLRVFLREDHVDP